MTSRGAALFFVVLSFAPPAGAQHYPLPLLPEPAPPPPRITFEVRFPAERGGGTAAGSAGEVEYLADSAIQASGGVEVKYRDTTLRAERVTVQQADKTLVAEGNVTVDQGNRRMAAERATYDLESRTGVFHKATASGAPDYYFTGEEVAKTGENTYRITDGVFTSCAGESPAWSFRVAEANVELEGYARIQHARFRVKKAPVLYFPYVLWPAKQDRASGFLVPNIGYSKRRGAYLGLAYFQTLGRSVDATVLFDGYEEEYYGVGGEVRYQPTAETGGVVRGFLIDDPFADDNRWKLSIEHETRDLPWDLRGVIDYEDYSDFEFFRDFERELADVSRRNLYSSAFVAGNWGVHSLNILADERQTFIDPAANAPAGTPASIISHRQLPEVEYRLRNTRLGKTPLYLQFLGSVGRLDIDRVTLYSGSYERADLFPQLSLPLRPAPWLSLSLSAGGRATFYQDSVCRPSTGPGDDGPEVCGAVGQELTGESLERTFPTAGAQVVGPSLARIFGGFGSFAKFKHVIEPRVVYSYTGEFDDRQRVPLFDEVDNVDPTDGVRVSLVNRVLGKPQDTEGGGAREVFTFELSQNYSFDEERPLERAGSETSASGPLRAELRLSPSARTNVRVEADYSRFFDQILSRSLSGSVALGRHTVGATWFTRYAGQTGETTGDQAGFNAALFFADRRLRLDTQLNYDLETSLLQQQRYIAEWSGSCWGLRLEWREFESQNRQDRDWRVAVSLKNVGSFLDFGGGDQERFD